MIIILGAGQYGVQIRNHFFENREDIVFYDNDRRKWGKTIDNAIVITLEKFQQLIRVEDTQVVVGGRSSSLLFFLKDAAPACQILKVADGQLVAMDIEEIGEFSYDNALEVGTKNLEKHISRMDEFKQEGKTAAYKHASEYIEFKKEHLRLPEISSIELTNNCNLKCPNCPNATLSFHKGYMSDEVFEKALKYLPPYKNDTIAVHCMGEPLLHPKLIVYLKRLAELEINICMSTNGVLLEGRVCKEILSIFSKLDKAVLYVSFHTKKSVENWYEFLKLYQTYPDNNIIFRGQVLEHNQEEAYRWLKEIGIEEPLSHPYIRHISSHSFAGNVPGRKTEYNEIEVANRIRNCYYLLERKVAVMWDGTLRGCCYDSNATQNCGNIFEFEKADINPRGYDLCRHCDPDWITGWQ